MRVALEALLIIMPLGGVEGYCHGEVIAAAVVATILIMLMIVFTVSSILYRTKRLILFRMSKENSTSTSPSPVKVIYAKSIQEKGLIKKKRLFSTSTIPLVPNANRKVTLQGSSDFGLGFSIIRTQTNQIKVGTVHKSGPAIESSMIYPGDRIESIKIYFDNINLEDAMTFTSYAGKYRVTLELAEDEDKLHSCDSLHASDVTTLNSTIPPKYEDEINVQPKDDINGNALFPTHKKIDNNVLKMSNGNLKTKNLSNKEDRTILKTFKVHDNNLSMKDSDGIVYDEPSTTNNDLEGKSSSNSELRTNKVIVHKRHSMPASNEALELEYNQPREATYDTLRHTQIKFTDSFFI